ncbi:MULTISPECIES: hypothetical protein [unclassified Paenibacillus]|uniref:hypothetical protein n=1 Tax=unclassified Paenibacillus TaxID=185978 RepID=UPI001AE440B9|nr:MULTISPECIES: hypothetical protein [unclassified Paenibacillus]MBP1155698.1 hypothetical protein [Paenibacillus sp. PvP091]MBP1168916.1 hypothetical protein [Paenibacillus sp. PvR098]MBP2439944.1 hypothetical protein [Paenibacillus sp. PvP052]
MTIQDLKNRVEFMNYLGFDESKKMWVYSYQDKYHNNKVYGLIAGRQTVAVLPSLEGVNLTKL